jgi:hypothetical protein
MATNNCINQLDPFPLFFAYPSVTINSITGDGTVYAPIAFNSILYDYTSSFNTGTFIYTAPTTGIYFFLCELLISGLNVSHITSALSIVTTSKTYTGGILEPYNSMALSVNQLSLNIATEASMTAGDTAYCKLVVSAINKTINIVVGASSRVNSKFQGCLIR